MNEFKTNDFLITAFQEELVEAVHWHALAVIEGSKEKQQETIRRLDECYAVFRHYTPHPRKD
jgi:hypothetical protein